MKVLFNIKFIFCLCLIGFVSNTFAQTSETKNQRNVKLNLKQPEGTEFWLCFEKNYKEPEKPTESDRIMLELFITGNKDANVNIQIEGLNYKQKLFVPAGTVKNVKIPAGAQIRSEEIIERLAVHVTSDNPISVYGLNRRFQTTDTYLGLPTNVLGKEYRTMCYTVSQGLMSQFAIVATEDSTIVTIMTTANTTKYPANYPYKVYLNKGEVYQVVANYELQSKCDLTGSLIKANKDIAVFSGHQCAYVTPDIIACNHLVEQMPPLSSWGKHFYIGKFKARSKYTYRVLANEDSTKVFEDNILVKTLKAGEYYESEARKNIQLTATKPVLVAQYSQGFRNGDAIGDPMMILISPTQQFLRHYRFATPIDGYWKHYINIVVPTNSITSLKLNGLPIDSSNFEKLGISRYSIGYIEIPFGTHTIEGTQPFGMYSYGFGYDRDSFDAYGNMGGQSFMDYEFEPDTIPPSYEAKYAENSLTMIIRDDKVNDLGIKSLNVLDSAGIKMLCPKFDQGVPQIAISMSPVKLNTISTLAFEVRDVADNVSKYSICYVFDPVTERYEFKLHEGLTNDCHVDEGVQIGLFGKYNNLLYDVNFKNIGSYKTYNKFNNTNSSAFAFGIYGGRKLNDKWNLSARLSLDYYNGTLEANGKIDSTFDDNTNTLKPYQENDLMKVKEYFVNLNLIAEYYISKYFYIPFGIDFGLNLANSIDVKRKIMMPSDYYFSNGKKETTPDNAPGSLGSLNAFNVGLCTGLGITTNISSRTAVFGELSYKLPVTSLVDNGGWYIHNIYFLIGAKMRF